MASSEAMHRKYFGPSGLCKDSPKNGYFGQGRHRMFSKSLTVKIPAKGPMDAVIFRMGTYKQKTFYEKYARIIKPLALAVAGTSCVALIGWSWLDGGAGEAKAAPSWSTPAPLPVGGSKQPPLVQFNWGHNNQRPLTTIQPPLVRIPWGQLDGGYRLIPPAGVRTFPGNLDTGSC